MALAALRHGWQQACAQLERPPDWLLISGDLCQDESFGGYVRLRELLEEWGVPVALLPGNHDHPLLLRAALGRWASVAPSMVPLGAWWFGGSSVVAGVANLVMVPLVGMLVVPLALLAVLAMNPDTQ